jgi:hypothetical protein
MLYNQVAIQSLVAEPAQCPVAMRLQGCRANSDASTFIAVTFLCFLATARYRSQSYSSQQYSSRITQHTPLNSEYLFLTYNIIFLFIILKWILERLGGGHRLD